MPFTQIILQPLFYAWPTCATPARKLACYTQSLSHQALLLALTRRPMPIIHDTLTLRDQSGAWTPAFRTLAGEFYLAF